MSKSSKTAPVPEALNQLVRGFMSSRAVLTAIELDIFTAVGQGARAAEVAGRTGADARAAEMLLNALASLGLLEKREGVFHNTPLTTQFLTEGSPDNARPGLMHTVNLWTRWSTLTACVRRGAAVATGGARDEAQTRAFIAAMDRNASELAPQTARAVGDGVRRMLDLGGGSGAYSIAFAKANPELRAEILDLPEVLALTNEYIAAAGVADRVTTRAGDMLTDDFGEGYDLVLLAAICHMFSPDQNRSLFKRAYQALAPGGKLMVRDFILEPDKTAPEFAALFSLNMLVNTPAGASYSEEEYTAWMREAGFAEVQRVRMQGPSDLIVGRK
ncbi:MAG: methyltransferase [Terriglobales bacterium]